MLADDAAFDAARVAVGRMGVIYALVLEVVPAYSLLEVYFEEFWHDIRQQLATSIITSAGDRKGMFDVQVSDLESGWFLEEVRKRSAPIFSSSGSSFGGSSFGGSDLIEYKGGLPSLNARVTATAARHMLLNLRLGTLAEALRGTEPKQLHHCNISVNLADPVFCWVTRRWKLPADVPAIANIPSGFSGIDALLRDKQYHRQPTALIRPLQDLLGSDPFVLYVLYKLRHPLGLRLVGFIYSDIPTICITHEQQGAMIGEALFLVMYKLITDQTLGAAWVILGHDINIRAQVLGIVSKVIGGDTVQRLLRCGLASEILDTQDYALDGAQSGNSAEYFFDANGTDYLSFIDTVINLSNSHAPVLGYMGIRFTPKSTALIAMQDCALTVSVEVATARSRLEDVYAAFWRDLHATANSLNAKAHWGQEFRQSKSDTERRYGSNLSKWRKTLAEMSCDRPATFSTEFSRAVGLEPSEDDGIDCFFDDGIDCFLAGLQAAM